MVFHFSFPGATNETLLQKFNSVHKDNSFYEIPQRRENAFIVRHYAGKVKYQVSCHFVIYCGDPPSSAEAPTAKP